MLLEIVIYNYNYSIRSIIVIKGTSCLSAFCMTEWVESMGVASGCCSKKVYILNAIIDSLISLIPTPLVSALFGSSIPNFC